MRLLPIKFRKFLGFLAITVLVGVGVAVIAWNQPSVLTVSATHPSATNANAISAKPIERSLFGMHIADSDKIPWPAIPFGSWRLWDTATRHGMAFWAHLERQKGQWDFRTLDHCVELAQRHKVELLYTMGMSPQWASARPNDDAPYGKGPTPAEPKNMEDWRNYVRTVATRYKGKIRYYEPWNEPNLKRFFSGSVDQMVALTRETYTILKQIDPSITVVVPALSTNTQGLQWLDEFFSKGGGKYADVISAHFYPKKGRDPEDNLSLIRDVQNIIAKHGLEQKPLWNTETGYGNKQKNDFYSDEESMAIIARTYILNWVLGIERFYWYAWDNRNVITLLMVEEDNKTLTPAAKAYAEIQKWLVGSRIKKCEPDRKKTWMCELTGEGGNTNWIVWNPKHEQSLKIPEKISIQQIYSLYGEKTVLPDNRRLKVGRLPILLSQG
ncbi:MAG: glycosyl hydrolase [Cyanobacteriota bacterium]